MQNPVLAIIGLIFLLTGAEMGRDALRRSNQYETAIVTRFGKPFGQPE